MDLVRQPKDSNLCGQSCVAMILGISLDEATELIGKKGKTSTRHLVAAFKKRGFDCSPRAHRIRHFDWSHIPTSFTFLIVRVTKDKLRHWIVFRNGKIYDPASGVFRKPPNWMSEKDVRPKSYLIVAPSNPPPR